MSYVLLAVAVMTAVAYVTRAVPFLFFAKRQPPSLLGFLQKYMPPVVMAILVFASYKDIDYGAAPFGVPALVAGAATAVLHFWKRNVLLSIVGGTALYMALIRIL